MLHNKKESQNIAYTYIIAIFISIVVIITVNYYTLKSLNGLRAFISGESQFTKGQQEACRYLILYIYSGNADFLIKHKKNLQVPISDSLARVNINKGGNDDVTFRHFVNGNNNPLDIPDIIWVYKTFHKLPTFKKAVLIWEEADYTIMELEKLVMEIKPGIEQGRLKMADKNKLITRVNQYSEKLVDLANNFDGVLSHNIRIVNRITLIATSCIAILTIACIVLFFALQIRQLSELRRQALEQNIHLQQTNSEMNMFTYSVSHDLRSPITSLQGLLHLAENEEDKTMLHTYFQLMHKALERQDFFIRNIIHLTKHKQTELACEAIYLPRFFDEIIADVKHSVNEAVFKIIKDIEPLTLHTDLFRLRIIFHNLISNAIKYRDNDKESLKINISARLQDHNIELIIGDNGIGISESHHANIFNMFYVVNHHEKGTGLGLYLVLESVKKLGGTIALISNPGIGTTFTIYLPV
ncbi:Adaptive-response sensory-kinase SasA [compost metagenome]